MREHRVFLLVSACREAGLPLEVLPGPVAFIPALVGSGFPCDRFFFEGFLPHKKGRKQRWNFLKEIPHTIVLYESPYRLIKCLEEAKEFVDAERKVCVVRELTKIHEEYHFGNAEELLNYFNTHPEKVKGEIVIILQGKPE